MKHHHTALGAGIESGEHPRGMRPKQTIAGNSEPSRLRLSPLLLVSLLASTQWSGFWRADAASTVAGQNWPQWRGPLQNGVSPNAVPPTEWSETKNVKWKVKIPGEGHATPIIWGERVFVLTAIPTGKKVEPKAPEVADQSRPPAGAPQAREDQPGQFRGGPGGGPPGGPGGRGGPGGFGPGTLLGQQMVGAGDKNTDQKLSREEFRALADSWFYKLDTENAGQLNQERFVERFNKILGPPPEGAPRGRGGRGGGFIAPGFFGAVDANKDGALTREEIKTTFAKWFTDWDADKSDALTEAKLREGLNAALPRPQFGGPGGPGGGRGGRGGFGGGGQKPTEVHQFVILCLDRQTGKVLWQQTAREEVPHEGHHQTGSFAAPSPVTDGKHVFAYFGSRGLYCYDMDGKLQWSQDFGDMRTAGMPFGEGSSPALYGETLIVNWDHEDDSFIIALDKNTGKTLWKQPREERTSWSTPLVVEHDGKPQVVTSATGKIRSYDLATGKDIWECSGLTANVIPNPVAGDGIVYAMSGFRGNALLAIRLGRGGDLTGTDAIVWRHAKSTPYVPSPMLYGNKLYFFASFNGRLSCFDAKTGQPYYEAVQLEAIGNVYASPVAAAGRVYLVGREGTTLVVKNSDKLELLATNKLDDGIDASPAIAGNELFLRGHESLYCIAAN